jgi:hypothetical protein
MESWKLIYVVVMVAVFFCGGEVCDLCFPAVLAVRDFVGESPQGSTVKLRTVHLWAR